MRSGRRGRLSGTEFGGSGEDSFVAVVVTKLTGALLFILLLTMVIMALIPRANSSRPVEGGAEPLEIATQSPLPDSMEGRPYRVTLAARGGVGPLQWSLEGSLPQGLAFDAQTGVIQGTPSSKANHLTGLMVTASDGERSVTRALALAVLSPASAPAIDENPSPYRSATWLDWLQNGFGYVVLAIVWMGGLGVVGSLERWSSGWERNGGRPATRWRFVGYRVVVTLAAVAAAVWMTRRGLA